MSQLKMTLNSDKFCKMNGVFFISIFTIVRSHSSCEQLNQVMQSIRVLAMSNIHHLASGCSDYAFWNNNLVEFVIDQTTMTAAQFSCQNFRIAYSVANAKFCDRRWIVSRFFRLHCVNIIYTLSYIKLHDFVFYIRIKS